VSDARAIAHVVGDLESAPQTHTVADRLARVAYTGVAAENCAFHPGGPRPTLDWWLHSSGHHRNLLGERYREVGAADAGDWWTQEFGDGVETMEALGR